MKRILILMLCVGLNACANKDKLAQNSSLADPDAVPQDSAANLNPTCSVGSISDLNKEWSLPVQVFSANDFTSHAPLLWCDSSGCGLSSAPAICSQYVTFNDFSVYSETSATFFSSIPEDVSINTNTLQITLVSDTTGHKGMTFNYKFLKASNEWLVTFGKGCGRLYQYAL